MLNLDTTICRLSRVRGNEEVKALSYAKFPGTHCPLFGVVMIASFLSDLAVLVVGTGECTYYSKGFAHLNQKGRDNFYSLVIGKNDLTFGCGKKVLEAVHKIDREEQPAAIMVVTTCVLEVIGEDVGSLLAEHENRVNARLLLVNTEHFKCGSHIPGMERALASLAGLMKPGIRKDKSINILGHRKPGVEQTEVIRALDCEGMAVQAIIPSNCAIPDLQRAAEASLNVVTDFTALPLAREMEKRLSIPYVYFGRHLAMERIDREYQRIEELFGVKLIAHLEDKRSQLGELEGRAKELFAGKSFIYGNTPMMAFEVSEYLCSLGMEPLFLQIREYYEEEREDMDRILARGFDPYIAQIANIAPMQEVYDLLRPAVYVGHENPMSLHRRGIVQITADEVVSKIGYEVPIEFLRKIIAVYEASLQYPHMPSGMMGVMRMPGGPMPAGAMASVMAGMGGGGRDKTAKGIEEWLEELSRYATQESKLRPAAQPLLKGGIR